MHSNPADSVGAGMRIHSLLLVAALAAGLSACAEPRTEPARASIAQSAWYEEQFEVGLGHLDRVNNDWAALPR
jgi:hypothetical protein